jgi:hypothetical protein
MKAGIVMTNTDDSDHHAMKHVLSAFDALPPEQQSRALDMMRDLQYERAKHSRELEPIGGYICYFEDEADTKRSLPPEEANAIRKLKNRTEIGAYLNSLPDADLIHKYLYIQYRMTDGSLGQACAAAHIKGDIGGWNSINDADVFPFDHA